MSAGLTSILTIFKDFQSVDWKNFSEVAQAELKMEQDLRFLGGEHGGF